MAISYHVRFFRPIPSRRTGARSPLHHELIQDFETAEMAIARLQAPWRDIVATHADAIVFDNRPTNQGGGVKIIARRRNGGKLQIGN